MRSLDDRAPRPLRLVSALAVLGAWAAWMGFARVDVYATTTRARLEVKQLPSRVASPEAGRISVLNVALGKQVREGEILVQLDATVEQKQLDEALAHAATMEPKLGALREQMAAASEVRSSRWRLNGATSTRARVQLDEAHAAQLRQEELGVMAKNLSDNQLLSKADKVKADGDLAESQLRLRGAKVEISRLGATQRYEDKQEAARIAELQRQLSDLEADRTARLAAVETARAQIDRRTVRAAAAGRLGGMAALQVGDVIKAGDVIATVIPESDVHVVAELRPSGTVGRVVRGQRARVRLEGFSWTEYGMLDAQVVDVASEPANGTVRVELVIMRVPAANLPVQHGIPASVDVCVEQASPLALLLRDLGSTVAPAAPPAGDLPKSGAVADRGSER